MKKMGSGGFGAAPHLLDVGYGPSVASTVGCTWLMCSLCMAHIWPMYDLYMAYIGQVKKYIPNLVIAILSYTGQIKMCIPNLVIATFSDNNPGLYIYIHTHIHVWPSMVLYVYI